MEHLLHPTPHFNNEEMARFGLRAASLLILRREGGFMFLLILFKIAALLLLRRARSTFSK